MNFRCDLYLMYNKGYSFSICNILLMIRMNKLRGLLLWYYYDIYYDISYDVFVNIYDKNNIEVILINYK